MKKLLITLLSVLTILIAQAQDKTEQIAIPLSKPGERANINLDQMNGDIKIEGYDGKEILIKAIFATGYHKDCDDCADHKSNSNVPAGMKRIDSNPAQLQASERNNEVQISTESWKRKTNLEIRVPRNVNLNLGTVHGNIDVRDVSGDLELSSVNGTISATGISGSVLANSVNGTIKVAFKSVNTNVCSYVTLNGNVDVTLPPSAKVTAKMKSQRGEIYSDFDMVIEASKPEVRKEQGQYEVSINSWVFGKINGGGPEHTFQNMHGNILIRKGQ